MLYYNYITVRITIIYVRRTSKKQEKNANFALLYGQEIRLGD